MEGRDMNHRSTLVRTGSFAGLALLIMLLAWGTARAQRVVDVPPGFGTLNATIMGDTLGNGARVDSSTVYRLVRGGLYILNGTMDHRYPVHLDATAGAGPKPKIIQGVPSGGTAPTEAWAARATLTMKNIYMSALDELGGGHERVIRIRENRIRITLDSCVLDQATQAGFRFDATGARVFFLNSTISNIGTAASPNNGRGFDDRGNDIDTLWIENSTFYNLTSRVIRDAGGITNVCRINHCTMYNIGQWGVAFGPCVEATYTNNLIVNGGYYGANPRGIDLTGGEQQILVRLSVLPPASGTQTALIANNGFYLDSLIVNAYPDSITAQPYFDSLWTAYMTSQGTGATVYTEAIAFGHAPDAPANVVSDWYVDPAPPNPELDTVGVFDFAYANTHQAYTRGADGKPLGALTWHGISLTAVEDLGTPVPAAFRLYDNYPNPFNPETNIRFDLRQSGNVLLEVFNALGQKVATLIDESMPAGSYNVRWDATSRYGDRLSSGVYLYRLSTTGFVDVKKMALVK
ncbi:MAG: T9SS type A sorting domain-containing protein [Bacteroidetes bacterium]|nr:T9SS type A sorting domain-containing protein [Bacteroidota bacterium]